MPVVADVSPEQLDEILSSGCVIVDIRSAEDFAEGHIQGAVNVSTNALLADPSQLDPLLDGDARLAVVCTRGHTSRRAADSLAAAGSPATIDVIHSLEGGLVEWERSGRPVVAESAGGSEEAARS